MDRFFLCDLNLAPHPRVDLASVVINACLQKPDLEWVAVLVEEVRFRVEVVEAEDVGPSFEIVETGLVLLDEFVTDTPLNGVALGHFDVTRLETFVFDQNVMVSVCSLLLAVVNCGLLLCQSLRLQRIAHNNLKGALLRIETIVIVHFLRARLLIRLSSLSRNPLFLAFVLFKLAHHARVDSRMSSVLL